MHVLLLAGLTLAGPFGVDLGYYLHLGIGQWRLIWNQVPVSEVIADPDTPPSTRERLRLAGEIRAYAVSEIGLEGSDNYTTFCDIGEGPVVWVLTVAPADRLEPHRWSYPVVGSAPYRGFFDRDRAEKERSRFEERGYDTYLRGVSAFSTLGWFRDPLLSTMLDDPAIDLADLIIHEMTHATVWIEDDADFNESMATFVGRQGARDWVRDHFEAGEDSLRAHDRSSAAADRYRDLMHDLTTRLDKVYAAPGARDEKLAAKAIEIEKTRNLAAAVEWPDGFRDPSDWTINNASLSLFRTYHRKTDVFDRVLAAAGSLRAAVDVFQTCEGRRDPEAYLEAWLEQHETPE